MLLASPQAGLSAVLPDVIRFQFPMGPAQISGGRSSESRITAAVLPSTETETIDPQPFAVSRSGLRKRVSIFPPATSKAAKPLSPSTSSPKSIFEPPPVQVSQLVEDFMLGVRLRASPPVAGIK